MNEDLLERQLSDAMDGRAAGARPRGIGFDDVVRRAARHRRRRSLELVAVGVASILVLVVGVATTVSVRAGRSDGEVGTAAAPDVAGSPAPDRWAVFPQAVSADALPPQDTVAGVQPFVAGIQGTEVTPYLIVARPDDDHDLVLPLSGASWRSADVLLELDGQGSTGATRVITGTGFDPGSLIVVPNSSNLFRPAASGATDPAAGIANPYLNARPEVLLAAPESHAAGVGPVERIGDLDWVVLEPRCDPGSARCTAAAVGGGPDRLIHVEVSVPRDFDLRSLLASVELRSADEAGVMVAAPGLSEGTAIPNWAGAPYLTLRTPVEPDDSVWPADVPGDYCSAYRQWKVIQMEHLGAFATPGWIRWVEVLASSAPAEVAGAYATLAAEAAAGHDTSATEPGAGALTTVVFDGDARCPT